jgi:hypothetical protein
VFAVETSIPSGNHSGDPFLYPSLRELQIDTQPTSFPQFLKSFLAALWATLGLKSDGCVRMKFCSLELPVLVIDGFEFLVCTNEVRLLRKNGHWLREFLLVFSVGLPREHTPPRPSFFEA